MAQPGLLLSGLWEGIALVPGPCVRHTAPAPTARHGKDVMESSAAQPRRFCPWKLLQFVIHSQMNIPVPAGEFKRAFPLGQKGLGRFVGAQ